MGEGLGYLKPTEGRAGRWGVNVGVCAAFYAAPIGKA